MSSIHVDKVDLATYLATVASTAPTDLQPYFEKFRTQHDRKLWHQLTLTLEDFLNQPASAPYQIDLFNNFVRDFESKLNQLRLVQIAVKSSKQFERPDDMLEFLTDLLSRLSKTDASEAYVMLLSSLAHAKLLFGDAEGTRVDIEESGKILDQLDDVDPIVHGAYYSVSADYYKARAEYVPYYKNSLLYLACVNPEADLSVDERVTRAHDLGVSALLGETIYNFGELLIHPILDSLDGSRHAWLKELLFVFNEGNIGKFEALGPQLPREPLLQESYSFLRQKICLMALIEAVFKRNAHKRTMTFQIIAEETKLPKDEVEHLIMKALSLKLIRGEIDQVDETVNIDWVQPRVLSRPRIGQLADKLTLWIGRLEKVDEFVKSNSKLFSA
ncbi:uncharacterized protein EI90DRAFT_2972088 [Cantharellus anzutake]|uniref:uncharacterized protein n=1 Tax=Cantharellus anzutake TaxID=1750568 RepID=UPI00190305CA|nr:uncharacterized protein EI90DRAFT_2972088 [Cantharellus anzutake]KAF8332023.1 hypothetical protein EI90DRAFT_2972088 [Cantharellus anzutake]